MAVKSDLSITLVGSLYKPLQLDPCALLRSARGNFGTLEAIMSKGKVTPRTRKPPQ